MHINIGCVSAITARCASAAHGYLVVPNAFHRWCKTVIALIILILLGCFIAYAYAEKFHLERSFFYGDVRFSFVDGGYPEFFGYMLELSACAIFALCAFVHRRKHWYMWSAILFVVFMDDAFSLHETIGRASHGWLDVSPTGGDLIGFATTGLISAILWFVGIRSIADQDELCAYLVFTVYFAVLIFFGVGVDAAHSLFGKYVSETLVALVEDGGELLMGAIISVSALGLWLRQQQAVMPHTGAVQAAFAKSRIQS